MSKRNKEPSELQRVGPDVPSWLAKLEPDSSVDQLQEYRILPFLKVVQGQSKRELKEKFGEGAHIVSGANERIIERDGKYLFVPVYFFTEFCHWSDINDESSPTIIERTFDPTHEIAKKARDPNLRTQPYEGGFKATFREHLCFVGYIYGDHPLVGTPIVASFSRGEFTKGRAFCSSILLRRTGGRQVPLWAQVWEFSTGERDNGKYQWYGIDYSNPENPYITEEEVPIFKDRHEEFKALHNERRVIIDREDEKDVDVDVDVETSEM